MKTTTLTFTQQELQTLCGVLDVGVKAAGMQVVRPLAPILAKMEEAAQAFADQGNGVDTAPEKPPEADVEMKEAT